MKVLIHFSSQNKCKNIITTLENVSLVLRQNTQIEKWFETFEENEMMDKKCWYLSCQGIYFLLVRFSSKID